MSIMTETKIIVMAKPKTKVKEVTDERGDRFAAIEAAHKILDDLKKEMERDDHQDVAIFVALKNNDNKIVRGTVAGSEISLVALLSSIMSRDKYLGAIMMGAMITAD